MGARTRHVVVAGCICVLIMGAGARSGNLVQAVDALLKAGASEHDAAAVAREQQTLAIYAMLRNDDTAGLRTIAARYDCNKVMAVAIYTNGGADGRLQVRISGARGEGRDAIRVDFGDVDIADPSTLVGASEASRMDSEIAAALNLPPITGVAESIIYFAAPDPLWDAGTGDVETEYWVGAQRPTLFVHLATDPAATSIGENMQYYLKVDVPRYLALSKADRGNIDNTWVWPDGIARWVPIKTVDAQDARVLGSDIISTLDGLLARDASYRAAVSLTPSPSPSPAPYDFGKYQHLIPTPPPYSEVITGSFDPRKALDRILHDDALRFEMRIGENPATAAQIADDAVEIYNALREKDEATLQALNAAAISSTGTGYRSVSATVVYTGALPSGLFDVYVLAQPAGASEPKRYALANDVKGSEILPDGAWQLLLHEIDYYVENRLLPVVQVAQEIEYDVQSRRFESKFFISGVTPANKQLLESVFENPESIAMTSAYAVDGRDVELLGLTGNPPPVWLPNDAFIALSGPPFAVYPNITSAEYRVLNAGDPLAPQNP